MTIALLAAGNSVHTQRWANAFVLRGHTVHIITQHAPLPGYHGAVHVHRLRYSGVFGYLLNAWSVARIIRDLLPDVLNVHYASGYGTLSRSIRRIPVVLNVWGSDVFSFPDKGPLHRWLLVQNLRRADRLVSTSKAMAQKVRAILKKDVAIDVVPFGVDTTFFKPVSPRSTTGPLVIGTVKMLAPTYGIDILLKAFALLPTRIYDREVRARIIGTGPQEAELHAMTRDLGIADRVDFIGAVMHARVPAELAGFDVFVALSRSESFGVAVIEASACGLPVVVSNVGGLPEVVEDGVSGTLVPANDPAAAANAISALLSSAETRTQMGLAGRALMQEAYDWQDSVDRMLAVYKDVIANGSDS